MNEQVDIQLVIRNMSSKIAEISAENAILLARIETLQAALSGAAGSGKAFSPEPESDF